MITKLAVRYAPQTAATLKRGAKGMVAAFVAAMATYSGGMAGLLHDKAAMATVVGTALLLAAEKWTGWSSDQPK